MYRSLEKCCENFHLYIFAFDDKTYEILNKLQLKKATVVSLKDFEDKGTVITQVILVIEI